MEQLNMDRDHQLRDENYERKIDLKKSRNAIF